MFNYKVRCKSIGFGCKDWFKNKIYNINSDICNINNNNFNINNNIKIV